MSVNIAQGTGRRKTSVARVYLRKGNGQFVVNGKPLDDYFNTSEQTYVVRQALRVTDSENSFDIHVNVFGGGKSGQAGAILHGLARALVLADENNQSSLRANGFLTRDSRMVERKKYGRRGARRRFQFSKR
ncbi:MAG: 30S ribosomal protein S9 [Spirochaetaceae bacterium]|nr:MAG: 30S ribosomal protein S9 [Spirochaetaceae bacterium]